MIAEVLIPLSATVGFIAGALTARARASKASKQPEAICPCEHSVSFHEEGAGRCHGTEERSRYNRLGDWVGREYVPCTCQVYAGPEVISSLTGRLTTYRPIANPEDVA